MSSKNTTPKDFAEAVCSRLRTLKSECPKLDILVELFELMYYASLKTEESQPITLHFVYLDPKNPDPNPPPRIRNDRWNYVPLVKRIPVNVSNLVKIAKASDPRTSSFVIYPDARGHLFIWGIIDQGNNYYNYVNFNAESGHPRPGKFQVSVLGIGRLVAYSDIGKIAELNVNNLLRHSLAPMWEGPVTDVLKPGVEAYLNNVQKALPKEVQEIYGSWKGNLAADWIATLCRLLIRIQSYRHGGAILITPDTSLRGLNPKYKVQYKRLRSSLERHAILRIKKQFTHRSIVDNYLRKSEKEMPTALCRSHVANLFELEDSDSELDGTIWFISLLTRVDGLVLMNPKLEVKGFGVEITTSEEPAAIYKANDNQATDKRLRRDNYNYYGTRHRSMMRYCSQIPKSIGFVVSQDSIIRVITQVRSKLVMWDNIRLQLDDYVQYQRRRNSPRKT